MILPRVMVAPLYETLVVPSVELLEALLVPRVSGIQLLPAGHEVVARKSTQALLFHDVMALPI